MATTDVRGYYDALHSFYALQSILQAAYPTMYSDDMAPNACAIDTARLVLDAMVLGQQCPPDAIHPRGAVAGGVLLIWQSTRGSLIWSCCNDGECFVDRQPMGEGERGEQRRIDGARHIVSIKDAAQWAVNWLKEKHADGDN